MRRAGKQVNSSLRLGAVVGCAVGVVALGAAAIALSMLAAPPAKAAEHAELRVLAPIVRGNLALFPVVANGTSDASMLLTLDEGIRSGEVTVTEAGDDRGLVRPRQVAPGQARPGQGPAAPQRHSAEVNRLVLTNNSAKPLLLLAGEIVTGGKQDRVVGADRIVPPDSGPVDLGVFCVEPGRWVGSGAGFGSMGGQMAQPSVRTPAMAEKNQERVWENVRTSNANIAAGLSASETVAVESTTSYAKVFSNQAVEAAVSSGYGGPEGERAMLRELQEKGAVGVVVAVNGEITWADVFANTDLLARYWKKLVRSYVAEAMTNRGTAGKVDIADAQKFIAALSGHHEVVETEPGIFRRSDVTGEGYRVFTLTALLPKTGYVVHLTKLRQMEAVARY